MKDNHNFSAAQVRMARAALRWSAEELARRAGLEAEAVELFEGEEAGLADGEREALGRALYEGGLGGGLLPIPSQYAGEGVRFRKPAVGRGFALAGFDLVSGGGRG